MKNARFFLLVFALFVSLSSFAAEKLAIAEPVSKGALAPADIDAFWGILEASVHSPNYTLISRAALKQMLTEIGLADSSGLVNLNSAQKAQMGQLEGVNKILVSEVGKFGSGINCTLKLINASTGEIDQAKTKNIRVKSLDELADQIEARLDEMFSEAPAILPCALLATLVRTSEAAPAYLADDLNVSLENALINNGVPLQNLSSVNKILKDNNMGALHELQPVMYAKLGRLLDVEALIQVTITRFEITQQQYTVPETGYKGTISTGSFGGYVRVIAAKTGRIAASIPFDVKSDFSSIPAQSRLAWTATDYGKYLLNATSSERIIPALMAAPALRK